MVFLTNQTGVIRRSASKFSDWIKLNSGCVIVYPRLINKINLTELLTEKLENYTVISEIQDIQAINNYLQSDQIIVFDDIKMLSLVINELNFTKQRAKLIVLSTWGDEFESLDVVTSKLPQLALFHLDLVEGVKVDWNLSVGDGVLESVKDGIVSNWPKKQVALTSSLENIIALMQTGENPYTTNEIITISCSEDYESIIQKLYRFNSSEDAVLLTNIIPLIQLKGVSVIHITEAKDVRILLAKCPADRVTFTMHFIEINEKHKRMLEKIREANRLYLGLISAAQKLRLVDGEFEIY